MAKYISNLPIGNDLYKGRSQERLAEFISNYIKDKDNGDSPFQRIIGIEGEWGSGKSNVISMLKNLLSDTYIFYIHDAWGMQEDLQRRSLLQSLTSFLIQKDYLKGNTTRKNINIETRKFEQVSCSWEERLEFLLGNKSGSITHIKPSIAAPVKWFTLALALTGVSLTMGGLITRSGITLPLNCRYGELITIICFAVIPLLSWFIYMCFSWKNKWKDFVNVYGTSGTTTNSCETISSLEPSVSEFRSWMHDISNGLPSNKHLVVVFDNMDRLPKEKVKQLWSSIHTFFAENSDNEREKYEKIWCLIPYDEIHLCHAFDENDDLCKKFLLKTFPITYRVAKPVVSDYKDLCDRYLEEAFGKSETDLNVINRCYRLINAEPNPRNIIQFVNELVTLSNAWKEEIPLRYMALYILNKKNILYPTSGSEKEESKVTIDQNLLNGNYIKPLDTFFLNTEETLTYISMLVYGVDKVNAKQIPLINYLNNAVSVGKVPASDLQDRLTQNSNFFTILDDLINKSNIENVSNWVSVLSEVNYELLSEELKLNLTNSFENIAQVYIKSNLTKEDKLDSYLSVLIKRCRPSVSISLQSSFLTRYFVANHEDGHDIYKTITALETSWEGNDAKRIKIESRELEPKQYLDFVDAAKGSYSKYHFTVSHTELQKFVIEQIASDYNGFSAIEILLQDNIIDKSNLVNQIQSKIEKKDYQGGQLQRALKLFTMMKNLDSDFNFNQQYLLDELQASKPVVESCPKLYIETYLLLNGSQPTIEDSDWTEIAMIAITIYSTAKLCEICEDYSNYKIIQLMKFIIENDMHSGNMKFPWMSKMEWLRSNLNLDVKVILQYISNEEYIEFTQQDNTTSIQTLMPDCDVWIQALGAIESRFSNLLFNKVYDEISTMDVSYFYQSNGIPETSTYWAKALNLLVKDKRFPTNVPEFMFPMYEKHMQGIGLGNCEMEHETDTYKYLRNGIKYENISTKWNEVRTKFYNGEYRITEYAFTELHKWFEHTPISESDAPNFLNKCMLPIIESTNIQTIILVNKSFYSDAMNYIDESSDLREKLKTIVEKTNDEFGEFLQSLNLFNTNNSSDK